MANRSPSSKTRADPGKSPVAALGLREAVYRVVRDVPAGEVISYGEVARLCGTIPVLVGKALAGKIEELLERGTFDAWDRLTAETPESVLDLLELPGIGPKTAAALSQKFKISSLEDLRKFVEGGGLEMVDGIGPKTAERLKASLARR